MNCLRKNIVPDSGSIYINDIILDKQNSNIVSVFQDVGIGVATSMTPMENLALVFSKSFKFKFHNPSRYFNDDINLFLDSSGLRDRFSEYENTPVSELSGGQRQQVAILMAIMRKPQILLLDEFVSNLDPTVKNEILDWIKIWIKKNNITTIMVTHDHKLANDWGDKVLELFNGSVVKFKEIKR